MSIKLCIIMFWLIITQLRCERYQNDPPKLRKTYTNEFIFKLRQERFTPIVKQKAEEFGFVYESQMLEVFLCFTRDDIPLLSKEAYDVKQLDRVREDLSKYIVSIEQDYERSWLSDSEVKQYTALQTLASKRTDLRTLKNSEKEVDDINFSFLDSNNTLLEDDQLSCKKEDIYVAFVDQGFELEHPSLKRSTIASLSHNFITKGNTVLPDIYEEDMKNSYHGKMYSDLSHGTMSMGRVGAEPINGCDKGVATHVKLVGLKALSFNRGIQDTREAKALSYRHDDIDVFACCYGIKENIGFFGPRSLTKEALQKGATKSKDCRGVIYIYPSGNGYRDNCNADGYANSVDTITIAAVNRTGHIRHNGEVCAAALAATVGEGYNTTSLNHLCSDEFKGSSAACAVSAGFVGELRVIRPCLSKRDIEHIMVKTAISDDDKNWRENGAGLKFNDYIGFGHLDLKKMTDVAKVWHFVPRLHICEIDTFDKTYKMVTGTKWSLPTYVTSDACRGKQKVNHLEHVQVKIDLNCDEISQVAIQLISPAKTVSNILTKMNILTDYEDRNKNLNWTFMSVNFWNEVAEGLWTVNVIVDAAKEVECKYRVNKLILYGTEQDPYKGTDGHSKCKETDDVIDHVSVNHTPVLIIIGFVIVVVLAGITVAVKYLCKRNRVRQGRCSDKITTNEVEPLNITENGENEDNVL